MQKQQTPTSEIILSLPESEIAHWMQAAKGSVFPEQRALADEIAGDALYKLWDRAANGQMEKVSEGYWETVNGQKDMNCQYGVRNKEGKLSPVTYWLGTLVKNDCRERYHQQRVTTSLSFNDDDGDMDIEDTTPSAELGDEGLNLAMTIWEQVDGQWEAAEAEVYAHYSEKHYRKQKIQLAENSPCASTSVAIAEYCRRWVTQMYRTEQGLEQEKISQDELFEQLGIIGASKGTFSGYVKDYSERIMIILRQDMLMSGVDMEAGTGLLGVYL